MGRQDARWKKNGGKNGKKQFYDDFEGLFEKKYAASFELNVT